MADSSSKLIKALFSSSNSGENKTNFDASKINPRILKILGVNEFDIEDEQEYLSLLKEKMLLISMEKSKLPREDEEVIIEEFKRIKSKKFPKKKLTADSFKKNLSLGENFNLSFGEKISSVIGKSNFIDISKIIPKSFIETELDFGKTNEPEEVKNIEEELISEEIDEKILRLLNLKDTFDIDYGTYISLLKEKLVLSSLGKQKIPREEEVLLQEEYKRVKSKKDKGRFKPKKKITAEIFATEPSVGNIKNNLLFGEPEKRQLALPPAVDKMSGKSDIQEIIDSLASIIDQLTLFNSLSRDEQERDRRATENRRRREREGELEKGFDGVMKAAEKVIAPVKSILDRIINFLVMTLIGRSLVLILRWFSDPENKEKVKAIGRFLGEHWPKLLALFIAFGTGLGGFVRGLIGVVIKGTGALIKGAFWLAKKAGIKGAAGAFKFLGGPKGKLIGKGLELAAVVGGTLALSKGLEDFGGIGGGETSPPAGLSGEEETTPRATFSGGGFANLKNLFGNIGGMFNGVVSGPKGTDKVPAMLTDGEFVMSPGAVKKYGVGTLEAMNAAGGGTNKPKIMNGTTYAAGGGLIGDPIVAQQSWMNYMNMNPEKFKRGSIYGNVDSVNNASRDFMKTFMKTGEPPKWANIQQRTTGVNSPRTTAPKSHTNVDFNYQSPSNTSMVRSPGAGLSANARPPVQRINTNMNVPGGRIRGGSLSAILAAFEMKQRKDEGQTNVQAGLGAGGSALGGQLGWMGGAKAGAIAGAALGSIVPGLGTGVGAAVGAIVGGLAGGYGGGMLGGKLADDISGVNVEKERNSRGGIGGAIKGGWGLRKQEFKDAPKTSIITDDKGRPFVGHKALRGGKLVYVRGPEPGTGTTNPLEILGRMINPGAYKENDAKLAGQKHKEAMVNALEGFQNQDMAPDAQARMMKQMGGNLKDVQNDLDFRKKTQAKIAPTKPTSKSSAVTPPQQNKVNVTYVESMKKRRAARTAGGTSSAAPQVPQFSSSSRTRSRKRTASTYGIG
jgi:hypothetical protein